MGVIVVYAAYAGLLVSSGKPLQYSHRTLYTYLVMLIASFVSMVRLVEDHELQIEIFLRWWPLLCWLCLSHLLGMPLGRLRRSLRVRSRHMCRVWASMTSSQARTRGRLSQDRMCVLCLKMLWNRLVTIRSFNAGRGFRSVDQVLGILSCVSRTTKVTYSMSLCGQPGT